MPSLKCCLLRKFIFSSVFAGMQAISHGALLCLAPGISRPATQRPFEWNHRIIFRRKSKLTWVAAAHCAELNTPDGVWQRGGVVLLTMVGQWQWPRHWYQSTGALVISIPCCILIKYPEFFKIFKYFLFCRKKPEKHKENHPRSNCHSVLLSIFIYTYTPPHTFFTVDSLGYS